MTRRTLAIALLLVVTGIATAAGWLLSRGPVDDPGTSAAASCAAPTIALTPDRVGPGDRLTVTGTAFVEECADQVVNGVRSPVVPMLDLSVALRQGERTWVLADGVAATGDLGAVDLVADVPDDVGPGRATVEVAGTTATAYVHLTVPRT